MTGEVAQAGGLESRVARAGLKMTEQRRIILRILAEADDHPSVETVHERARAVDSAISLATVYRTLNLLGEKHLVQKHDFNESHARFEANLAHHHHLIDLDTGEVIEFTDRELELLKKAIADRLGYDLIDHRLELYGRRKRDGA